MSSFLIRCEAIEAHVASHSCPGGVSGRLSALRLKRHFHRPSRTQSSAVASIRDWEKSDNVFGNGGLKSLWPEQLSQPSRRTTDHEIHAAASPDQQEDGYLDPVDTTVTPLTSTNEYTALQQRSFNSTRVPRARSIGLPWLGRATSSETDVEAIRHAIRDGSPQAVLVALMTLLKVKGKGEEVGNALRSIRSSTFSELIRSLNPDHLVDNYLVIQKQMSPRKVAHSSGRYYKDDGLVDLRLGFIQHIKAIMAARRSQGLRLSSQDYKTLLRCARAVGNPTSSHAIWLEMSRDGVEMDTECYNHYLAAKVWSDLHNGASRHKVRVLPKNTAVSQWKSWSPQSGIILKHEATTIFNDMTQKGVTGDEETFCLLMVALARAGDVDGVKSILMTGWGIDVDKLMTKDERSLPWPKQFAEGSPFRPSEALLMAIAHTFGINNAIPTALRLVDYISRMYSISIPTDVWEELFERTFVVSQPRTTKREAEGYATGKLPLEAVHNLWAAMTSDPYNVRPTLAMFDKYIVNLIRQERFGEAQDRIREAFFLHVHARRELSSIQSLLPQPEALLSPEGTSGKGQDLQRQIDLRRDAYLQRAQADCSRQFLQRWCRLFIARGSRSLRNNPAFSAITIPEFMREYLSFMPREMEYRTGTGIVKFWSGSTNFNRDFIAAREGRPRRYGSSTIAKRMPLARSSTVDESITSEPVLDTEEAFGKS
jgi:hypothetical protein